MKKITSFLLMAVLCCIGAFAQESAGSEFPAGKMVGIGTAQATMVPNQWYFLHQGRDSDPDNNNSDASHQIAVGDYIAEPVGGFVYDTFDGSAQHIRKSHEFLRTIQNAEDGVSADVNSKYMVRFVPVEGEEGAYYVQFGNNRYLAAAPDNGTLPAASAIQSGQAGKYNFYLIKDNEVENDRGLFGWNKYNMLDRVDNNGGKEPTVVFWETGEWAKGDKTDIFGNNVWQIFSVEILGDVDPYNEAYNKVIDAWYSFSEEPITNTIDALRDGTLIGDTYGKYSKEAFDAWVHYDDEITELFNGNEEVIAKYPEAADLEKLYEDYMAAWDAVVASRVSLEVKGINAGYYAIKSCLTFNDTEDVEVEYTQEEADAYNAENNLTEGMEGFVHAGDKHTVQNTIHPVKAIYADNDGLKWDTAKERGDYLWKIETVADQPTHYRLISMLNNKTITNIAASTQVALNESDTATVIFEYTAEGVAPGTGEESVLHLGIRSASQAAGGRTYLHANNHGSGNGKNSNIVGWSTDADASRWYLSPVSDEDAAKWMQSDEIIINRMLTKADSIAAAVPAQITIAKDIVTEISENDSVVVNGSQFYSQFNQADNDSQTMPEGKTMYDFLLDGSVGTYWHSDWAGGKKDFDIHYLQIESDKVLDGTYAVKMTRRLNNANGDHVTKMKVRGYASQPADDPEGGKAEGAIDLGEITLAFGEPGETVASSLFTVPASDNVKYLRFYALETKMKAGTDGGQMRGYWHAAEFNVFKATQTQLYPTTQYSVRKALADAVEAAATAWTEKGYDATNVTSSTDEEFAAAYNNLVNAYNAWAAVYSDPAELRQAIAAVPAENLFVKGNNPGQWPETAVTPATAKAAAQAYNESGEYTPANTAAHIKALQDAETNVFASANKVATNKWYRISFPTEEMYDTYKWDKTGAKAGFNETANIEYTPALFGKTFAAGDAETIYETYKHLNDEDVEVTDTLATYNIIKKDGKLTAGTNLYLFPKSESFTAGEDMFRFIEANDTAYMIQNKATGLFLTAGYPTTLSATPTYYQVNAIGAGANTISCTTVLGKRASNGYLHAQRDKSILTTWDVNTLGSNSMMMIEAAEDFAEAPATAYTAKYWPGNYNPITMPVDITVKGGATAYGAELQITETDTTVVLMTSKNEKIPAGSPFILVADLTGDFISYDDQYAEEKAKAIAASKDHNWGFYEKQEASQAMNQYYVEVELDHGMKVDTVVTNTRNLIGTLSDVAVKAGKHIYAEDNAFHLALNDGTIYGGSAYFECDVDTESEKMLAKVGTKVEGEIEIKIAEILNNAAKSNGNIYNAAGQLVGKGGLGKINTLPAGIYFMDGVKVIKK